MVSPPGNAQQIARGDPQLGEMTGLDDQEALAAVGQRLHLGERQLRIQLLQGSSFFTRLPATATGTSTTSVGLRGVSIRGANVRTASSSAASIAAAAPCFSPLAGLSDSLAGPDSSALDGADDVRGAHVADLDARHVVHDQPLRPWKLLIGFAPRDQAAANPDADRERQRVGGVLTERAQRRLHVGIARPGQLVRDHRAAARDLDQAVAGQALHALLRARPVQSIAGGSSTIVTIVGANASPAGRTSTVVAQPIAAQGPSPKPAPTPRRHQNTTTSAA